MVIGPRPGKVLDCNSLTDLVAVLSNLVFCFVFDLLSHHGSAQKSSNLFANWAGGWPHAGGFTGGAAHLL